MARTKKAKRSAVEDFKLRVMSKRCEQCLMSKGKIVSDSRRDEILEQCERSGKYFLCHKGSMVNEEIVCRGFYDEVPNQALRMASRLGIVKFTEPEPESDV